MMFFGGHNKETHVLYTPLVGSKNRWNFGLDARVFLVSPSGEPESSQKRVTNSILMHAFVSTIRTDFTRDLHLLSRSLATAGNFGQIAHDCFSLRGGGGGKTFFYFSPPFFLAFLLFLPPKVGLSPTVRRTPPQGQTARGEYTFHPPSVVCFCSAHCFGVIGFGLVVKRKFLGEAKVFAFPARDHARGLFFVSLPHSCPEGRGRIYGPGDSRQSSPPVLLYCAPSLPSRGGGGLTLSHKLNSFLACRVCIN